MVNLTYLVHWVHIWFYFHISCLETFKALFIIMQMHQCLSALLLQEILTVLYENSPCFKAVLHLRVVCCIIFGFLFSYCDHCKLVSIHLSCNRYVKPPHRDDPNWWSAWVICHIRLVVWSFPLQWRNMAGWGNMCVHNLNLIPSGLLMPVNHLFR